MHFCGQVFIKQEDEPIEDDLYPILEPYWEQTNNPKYLKFHDGTDELNAKWPEVKDSGEYKDVEDLAYSYFGFEKHGDKYGYFSNPDAHWDWLSIGGRWDRGDNIVKAKDFKFDGPTPEEREDLKQIWKLITCKDEWDDGQKALAASLGITIRIYKPEYYIEKYGNEDTYIENQGKEYPYCFIDTNGDWHEPGEIGWFSDNVKSEGLNDFQRAFVDELEKAKNSEETVWLVNVDFHI